MATVAGRQAVCLSDSSLSMLVSPAVNHVGMSIICKQGQWRLLMAVMLAVTARLQKQSAFNRVIIALSCDLFYCKLFGTLFVVL